MILNSGDDPNLSSKYGETSLMDTSENNHIDIGVNSKDISKLLYKYGADLSYQDIYGDTALTVAIKNKHIDIVKFLIPKVDNVQNINGPLSIAKDFGNKIIERLIIEAINEFR